MKFVKIFGVFFALLIVAIVVILMTLDVGKYKGVVQDQAKSATGRDVSVGDISLSVSLNPAIVISDFKVANAPWGSRPEMLTLKKIEAHTQLIPLLFGKINITKLVVVDPDVLFETDKQGKGNWEFGGSSARAEAPAASSGKLPLSVSDISVTGLRLAYKDAKDGMSADVVAKSIAVDIAGEVQDLNISSVALRDAIVNVRNGKTLANASVADFAMKAKGKITDLGITSLKMSSAKVNYRGEGSPIDAAVDKLSLDDAGALDMTGNYGGQEFKANGTVAPVAVLASMKKAFPVKVNAEALGLKLATDLVVDLSKKTPSAKGSISIPEVDLAKFMPAQPAQQAPAKAPSPPPGQRLFPDTPLPWEALTTPELDVKTTIGKLSLPNGLVVTDIVVPLMAGGGKIGARQASLAVAGGTLTADFAANANEKSVALKGSANGFTAEHLAKEMKKAEFISQGPLDFNVDVHGRGGSVHAIMASLSGSMVAGMGESKIRNDALNFIGADILMSVLNALNPMGNKDPYTVARCGVVNFQIANGIATTQNGVALLTDKMQVTSSGTVNLDTERLDLTVRPKAVSGIGVGLGQFVSAVKLSGPITSPGIGIDKAGAAKAIGTLGAAFATGGLSVLAQGAKERTDTASGDICATARTWQAKK